MSVTLVHTADWQIGKSFGNLPDELGPLLREQRLKAVESVASLAAARRADAVLVAGDVFDTNGVSDQTLRRTLNAMQGFSGPWVLLPGNHDPALAASAWTRLAAMAVPANVVLAVEARPIVLCDGRLTILPAPLLRRHDVDDGSAWFDTAETMLGSFRVGLAHGSMSNRLPERSEALNPVADDRADTARLDYLALGDWHGTLNIAPRTWYAGTPEPDRFRNNDAGNALVVRLESPGGAPEVERVPVGFYRWLQREETVNGPTDVAALAASLASLPQPQTQTLLSLRLQGTVDLATRRQVEDTLGEWSARLRHLDADLEALLGQPSADDLDAIDTGGFVRATVEQLSMLSSTGDAAASANARLALQTLYLAHRRLGN